MKTELEISNFKGNDIFSIWEVDKNGIRNPSPIISFGRFRGSLILQYINELKDFCLIYDTTDIPWDDSKGTKL